MSDKTIIALAVVWLFVITQFQLNGMRDTIDELHKMISDQQRAIIALERNSGH